MDPLNIAAARYKFQESGISKLLEEKEVELSFAEVVPASKDLERACTAACQAFPFRYLDKIMSRTETVSPQKIKTIFKDHADEETIKRAINTATGQSKLIKDLYKCLRRAFAFDMVCGPEVSKPLFDKAIEMINSGGYNMKCKRDTRESCYWGLK